MVVSHGGPQDPGEACCPIDAPRGRSLGRDLTFKLGRRQSGSVQNGSKSTDHQNHRPPRWDAAIHQHIGRCRGWSPRIDPSFASVETAAAIRGYRIPLCDRSRRKSLVLSSAQLPRRTCGGEEPGQSWNRCAGQLRQAISQQSPTGRDPGIHIQSIPPVRCSGFKHQDSSGTGGNRLSWQVHAAFHSEYSR